jgi:glutathione S-transferase
MKSYAKTLNDALKDREWLVGNQITLADLSLAFEFMTSV